MKTVPLIASTVLLLTTLTACGGSDKSAQTVLAPSPVATPVPTPGLVGRGAFAIRDISPAPGATLGVGDCRVGNVSRACADQWRGTFDVTVDLEMTNAVLTVAFYDGDRLCGYAANTADIVPAGSPVSFSIDRIFLFDEYSLTEPCQLPATTNRMELVLWSDASRWSNTLREKFDHSYTFSQS
jgi:hypothetical protein